MNPEKRKRLEARGWKFCTVSEFLGLTAEESAAIERRLKMGDAAGPKHTGKKPKCEPRQ